MSTENTPQIESPRPAVGGPVERMVRRVFPEPMTPADSELQGFAYMPFLGQRMFDSTFYATASAEAFRAHMHLLWSAWNQTPAGSLPNNDLALCRLAGLGRDTTAWAELKTEAMRGFVECDDGRMYHPVLSEQVNVAWSQRVASRMRKAVWRAAKAAKGTSA